MEKKKRRRLFLSLSALVFILAILTLLLTIYNDRTSASAPQHIYGKINLSGGGSELVDVDESGRAVRTYSKDGKQTSSCEYVFNGSELQRLQDALPGVRFTVQESAAVDDNVSWLVILYAGRAVTSAEETNLPPAVDELYNALFDPLRAVCAN